MRVDLFDFDLPPENIALRPASPRDSARLLLVPGEGDFADLSVRDLSSLLRAGDVLVFNDTRVIPAQLEGMRGNARIGATLHKRLGLRQWQAFLRNAKRVRYGDRIDFGAGVTAIAGPRDDDGGVTLSFEGEEPVEILLERAGRMPLPPYIASKRPTDERDRADYQTMFAREDGAVAAPTAALHFTPELMAALAERGIVTETLTLHVGAGTFLPVKADDTDDHRMHAEWGRIEAATAARLNVARAAGGRLIAVGTTSLRLLESAAGEDGIIRAFADETRIFITPGYRFRAVDGLMTNFHLPKSTLFMLVSALMGTERMRAAYAHAIGAGYRFYSYGDSSLLLP
ncbi:MAG: tRNA preQ1(34) S-adenosylmethionine ribosyltransferase-isomerase QueA [Sphingobium sp.]|jgi:S-adenosylmethionine:tRNA ribosyltransferase-isomerase|uniref:tRNA preQ1(34) S-adenosylmethionine ribosyltransferase-isomerase QueA n=1 Tax=Sphingobium sp. TaxID=1912891 RepID=UPI000C3B015A|nr:tRNA preQ1(34) S-adenosylmethionine ribosyltransferase-isomerase QueA [Sphingobium sp.]MBU0658835.1 tRNA preQ1(34) S-adenosylmethionine ribosyltransferase-isomerase QueA [Alphaproteobacteria bacterium]MBA4755038.1 tRNA preQ1(34) S-adenosylmethionine ribosyltransferase-isomerase QueA [Sphingobium sp.]MBS87014.1 tRNA preQ1(34) S-adenosylmethionine ribosyltransferase-isomerase QueA [Sphingobium sp.]MBU1794859.1 tRNA preQ1(34) S-adenosylmethionine ribosyltransferase-isomerase QueA [Alphaproteoba